MLMMTPLHPYRGFTASYGFDEADGVFHGRVLGIRDIVTFEADTLADLQQEFHDSVEDYLAFCEAHGKEPGPLDG